jgi:hypothetical protein
LFCLFRPLIVFGTPTARNVNYATAIQNFKTRPNPLQLVGGWAKNKCVKLWGRFAETTANLITKQPATI